jgi:hypothetical protein
VVTIGRRNGRTRPLIRVGVPPDRTGSEFVSCAEIPSSPGIEVSGPDTVGGVLLNRGQASDWRQRVE